MGNENDISLFGLDFGNLKFDLSEEEDRWKELINQIMAGNVIPVIGPDFQVDMESNDGQEPKNFHQWLIAAFARNFGVDSDPKTFSQLIYDPHFINAVKKPEVIYKLINQALSKVHVRPSDLLLRLLSTKKFPFVITTSFTPVVEDAMRQVWGQDQVNVLQFRNDPVRDLRVGEGDVQSEKAMRQPTVFYMFGKYSWEKYRYVVTDVDMMEFCKSWLAGTETPRTLTDTIKKRYLLVLGNNYSDWLFRFICYSLSESPASMKSMLMVNSHFDDDYPLIQFLHRLETVVQRDPEQVVREIERRIAECEREIKKEMAKESRKYENDVFLSYSRSDEEVVLRLYDLLTQRGLRVWYDRHNIHEAEKWRQAIIRGIHGSRIFVPFLTAKVENEVMGIHEYRTEWKEAAAIAGKMGGRTYIVPVAERGFDFYRQLTDVPKEFQELNATWYDAGTPLDDIANVIEEKVNEVKQLEQMLGHG